MSITQEQFDDHMDDVLELMTPTARALRKHDDVFVAIAIGMLLGAFLTSLKGERRKEAEIMVSQTLEFTDQIRDEMRRRMQ